MTRYLLRAEEDWDTETVLRIQFLHVQRIYMGKLAKWGKER